MATQNLDGIIGSIWIVDLFHMYPKELIIIQFTKVVNM